MPSNPELGTDAQWHNIVYYFHHTSAMGINKKYTNNRKIIRK
jgi:hypothetical protein